MTNELIVITPRLPSCDVSRAAGYALQDKAPSTRRAYQSDWRAFLTFCAAGGMASLPAAPETVAAVLAARAARYSPR